MSSLHFKVAQTKNEPLPIGIYLAQVETIELEEGGEFGPQVKFTFNILATTANPAEKTIFGWCSKKFSPPGGKSEGSKLYRWALGILGQIPAGYEFDPDDIMNKKCYLSLGEKVKENGTFNTIEGVKPYRTPQPRPVAPQPARRPEPEPEPDDEPEYAPVDYNEEEIPF